MKRQRSCVCQARSRPIIHHHQFMHFICPYCNTTTHATALSRDLSSNPLFPRSEDLITRDVARLIWHRAYQPLQQNDCHKRYNRERVRIFFYFFSNCGSPLVLGFHLLSLFRFPIPIPTSLAQQGDWKLKLKEFTSTHTIFMS